MEGVTVVTLVRHLRKGGGQKAQWNQVPIGEEFFTDKEFENLVSCKVILNYGVITDEDGTKEIFSGEMKEYGKYLDLHEHLRMYLNLKGVKTSGLYCLPGNL